MKHTENIGPAIIVSGIKLLYDFSCHNFNSFQQLLKSMQFFLKKYIPEDSISLYVSDLHNEEFKYTDIFFCG